MNAVADADSSLVGAAQAGSREAFGSLVDRYRQPIVRFAYRFTRNADEANDIAQDVFLRAYRQLGDFRPDRPFSRWLFVIARNAALDDVRRKRRSVAFAMKSPVLDEIVSPEELVLANDSAREVRTALAHLPERYRLALDMYYLRDMRYRDIALELDVPIGTVKTLISRAKQRMRGELAPRTLAVAA